MLTAFSKPDASKLEQLKEATAQQMGVKYVKPYEELSKEIKEILKESKLENEVEVRQTAEGIMIVSKGTLFFDSGSVKLKERAHEVTTQIAAALTQRAATSAFRVTVEGHTDDAPIISKYFPSNWELSASRASTVVRLFESLGFRHSDLRPMGFSDTEPVAKNRDDNGKPISENQSLNRRIVIRIQNKNIGEGAKKIDAKTDLNAVQNSPIPLPVAAPAEQSTSPALKALPEDRK